MVSHSKYQSSSSRGAFGFGGVKDWIIQRKTAVLVGLYFIYLGYFFVVNSPVTYDAWLSLFQPVVFKVLALIAFIALLQHAWVGVWTIATDYLGDVKVRGAFLIVCKTLMLIYIFWAIYILRLI